MNVFSKIKKNKSKERTKYPSPKFAITLLIFLCMVGGVSAYFIASDFSLNNFKYQGPSLTIYETNEKGEKVLERNYAYMPGATLDKDPTLVLTKTASASYIFLKVEKSEGIEDYLDFEINSEWLPLSTEEGIYYRAEAPSGNDREFQILKDDQVIVKAQTVDEVNALSRMTLDFSGYIAVNDGVKTPQEAWEEVKVQ